MSARVHELKAALEWFQPVYHGEKTAELRFDDRDFSVGDKLVLREYLADCDHYSGSQVHAEITHILTDRDGPWLAEGYVMLSFKMLERLP